MNDTEGEDVDVRVTELPIAPVHRQRIRSPYRNELQNEFGYEISIDDTFSNKSLDPAQ